MLAAASLLCLIKPGGLLQGLDVKIEKGRGPRGPLPFVRSYLRLPAVRLELVELDRHDSVRVEEDVRDLVEADPRPVGEGDVDAGGEGRLAFPERLSSVRVDLPVRPEPGDPPPGRVGGPVGGQYIDRKRA